MLYLPPGVAHHGIATGACMTGSIGFRAPSIRDMVDEFDEKLAASIPENLLYSDPKLQRQAHPAEITTSTLHTIEKILSNYLNTDEIEISRWFGEYVSNTGGYTQPQNPIAEISDNQTLEARLESHAMILQEPSSRFFFSHHGTLAQLFVDGNSYDVSLKFAKIVCQHYKINTSELISSIKNDMDKQTLIELYNNDQLYFPDDGN